jgi:hypothetical protein
MRDAFAAYERAVRSLPGATPIERSGLIGVHIDPSKASIAFPALVDALSVLVQDAGAA